MKVVGKPGMCLPWWHTNLSIVALKRGAPRPQAPMSHERRNRTRRSPSCGACNQACLSRLPYSTDARADAASLKPPRVGEHWASPHGSVSLHTLSTRGCLQIWPNGSRTAQANALRMNALSSLKMNELDGTSDDICIHLIGYFNKVKSWIYVLTQSIYLKREELMSS